MATEIDPGVSFVRRNRVVPRLSLVCSLCYVRINVSIKDDKLSHELDTINVETAIHFRG